MDVKTFWKQFFSNERLVQALTSQSEFVMFRKKDLIVSAGEKKFYLLFLVHGIVRGYYSTEDGREITDFFVYKTGGIVFPFEGWMTDATARQNVEVLEDCACIKISADSLRDLETEYPELLRFQCRQLENNMRVYYDIKSALVNYMAPERYAWFLKEYAEIFHRIKQKHIASFLQMTPNTLSKVRNGHFKAADMESGSIVSGIR